MVTCRVVGVYNPCWLRKLGDLVYSHIADGQLLVRLVLSHTYSHQEVKHEQRAKRARRSGGSQHELCQ